MEWRQVCQGKPTLFRIRQSVCILFLINIILQWLTGLKKWCLLYPPFDFHCIVDLRFSNVRLTLSFCIHLLYWIAIFILYSCCYIMLDLRIYGSFVYSFTSLILRFSEGSSLYEFIQKLIVLTVFTPLFLSSLYSRFVEFTHTGIPMYSSI